MQTSQWDPATRQQLDRWLDATARRLHAAMLAAAAAGQVDEPASAEDTAAQLLGPLLDLTVLAAGTVSDDLLEQVINTVLPHRQGGDQLTPPPSTGYTPIAEHG